MQREREREIGRDGEREKETKRVSFVDGERSFGVGNGIGVGEKLRKISREAVVEFELGFCLLYR